jgi:Family of unknown function (DUF6111)
MLRLVVENILLFLLPTVFYVVYALLKRHLDDGAQQTNQPTDTSSSGDINVGHILSDAPFIWLAFIGAALVFAVLVLFGSISTSNPNATYEPAVYKDGKIVPGRIK